MEVFFLLDLLGTAVFAYTGSVVAKKQRFHILGVYYIAVLTAVGGGTIRSVLLKTPDLFWMKSSAYLAVITIVVLGSYLVRINTNRLWFYILDSQSLAIFVALGISSTLSQGQPIHIAFAMGVLSGIGGGLIRDALTGQPPQALSDPAYPVMMLAAAIGGIISLHFGLEAWTLSCAAVLVVVSITSIVHYQRSGNLIEYNHWQKRTARMSESQSAETYIEQPSTYRPLARAAAQPETISRTQNTDRYRRFSQPVPEKSGWITMVHACGVIGLASVAGFYYLNQTKTQTVTDTSVNNTAVTASTISTQDTADEKSDYLAILRSIEKAIEDQSIDSALQHIDAAKRNRFADIRLEALIARSKALTTYLDYLDKADSALTKNDPVKLKTNLESASALGFFNPRVESLQASLENLQARLSIQQANEALAINSVKLHTAKAEHELSIGNLQLAKIEADKAHAFRIYDATLEQVRKNINDQLAFKSVPLTSSDIDFARGQFRQLQQAIKLKNLNALTSLTQSNQSRHTLLQQLFERYVSINTSITELSIEQDKKTVYAMLRLEDMRLPDGNIAVPSSRYSKINLKIRKTSKGWSRIEW